MERPTRASQGIAPSAPSVSRIRDRMVGSRSVMRPERDFPCTTAGFADSRDGYSGHRAPHRPDGRFGACHRLDVAGGEGVDARDRGAGVGRKP
ncbi:hypothetical protein GCM10020000_67900 [Streptomyces olivoverticillatus]